MNLQGQSFLTILPGKLCHINRRADHDHEADVQMTRARLIAIACGMAAVTPVYFFVLFATGALATVNPGLIGQLDLHVARLFHDLRNRELIWLFTVVTAFGSWGVVLLLATSASIILWLTNRLRYIPALWLALIGNQTLVTVLKGIFLRPRPEYGVYREVSASFPSGHSAVSFAFFGFLTYVLVRERTAPKVLVLVGGSLIVILVGISRLVLGEHYVSDVLSGYLVGAFWVVSGICLTELRFESAATTSVIKPRRRLAVYAVVVCTMIALWLTVETYVGRLRHDIETLDRSSVGLNIVSTAPSGASRQEC